MTTQARELDDRISDADKYHAQARAIVDLIGRSKGTDVNERTIVNACWCVEELLESLFVERREIETIALAVQP